jgi:uncharacterized membrane protein
MPTSMTSPNPLPPAPPQPPEHDDQQLLRSEVTYTENLRQDQPVLWWATLVGPLGLTAAMLVLAAVMRGWEFMVNLFAAAGAIFFGLGRAVLLMGNEGGATASGWQKLLLSLSTAELFVLIVWMDVLFAFLMVFHASYLYRIPKVGPAMLALQEDGRFILSSHPWFRRFAWLGLVAFVTFPFAATGSVGGSIVGRLLGLSRFATISGVVAGSLISTGVVFVFAKSIKASPWFRGDDWTGVIGGIVVIVALCAFLNWRYQKVKQRWSERGRAANAAGNSPSAQPPTPPPA